jgi:hypothetical protein
MRSDLSVHRNMSALISLPLNNYQPAQWYFRFSARIGKNTGRELRPGDLVPALRRVQNVTIHLLAVFLLART